MNTTKLSGRDLLNQAEAHNYLNKRSLDAKREIAEKIAYESGDCARDILKRLERLREAVRPSKPAATEILSEYAEPVRHKKGNAFIVTSAQNNSAVEQEALGLLKQVANTYEAELIILPIYYNKNAFSGAVVDEDERFDSAVLPFLALDEVHLFGGKVQLKQAAILPTNQMPTTRAASLLEGKCQSVVVASPKIQHVTLPRLKNSPILEAWSTGTVTVPNYARGATGSSAKRDHEYGAIMFVDEGEDGIKSYDLECLPEGDRLSVRTPYDSPKAVVLGDIHGEMQCDETWRKTIDWLEEEVETEGKLIEVIAAHDILHFSTRSHHNRNDSLHLYRTKDDLVKNDLIKVIEDLNELSNYAKTVYVVESNHNSALDNWLSDIKYNPHYDPHQAKLYHLLSYLVRDSLDEGEKPKTAIEVAFKELQKYKHEIPDLANNVIFGDRDVPFLVAGVDLSHHGDKGQNGSFGSTRLFSKWRQAMVTGHTHSPARIGKVSTAGVTAKLDQGYNRGGASSWRQSHVKIFSNGARQFWHVYGL